MTASGPIHGTTRRRTLVAAIVAVLLASTTYALWVVRDSRAVHEREVAAELQRNADAQASELDSLLTRWAHLLGSVRALDEIDGASFERFVDEALADRDLDGIPTGTFGGMGSVVWVAADGASAVIRHGRPDALLDQVDGLDLFLLPERRVALETARDTGRAAVTRFFVPATDVDLPPQQQSRLASIYVPFYAGGGVPPTVDERRDRLQGWAITGFRADALLDRIATDGRLSTTLVADGAAVWNSRSGGSGLTDPTGDSATAASTALGNDWSVVVEPIAPIRPRGGLGAYPLLEGFVVVAAGVGLSLGLWRIGTSREAALRIADRRRREVEAIGAARQHMADRLSIGLLDVDGDGIVRFANARSLELIGTSSGVVGSELDDLLAEISDADVSVATATASDDGLEQDVVLLPTTSGRHLRLTWTRGHTGGMLATVEDVTDHLTEIQELNESLDAAVEAHDQGQRLLATVSHEIRTPLAGMVGLARTLIDEGVDDRSVAERIARIERSGADLLRIADDALTAVAADTSTLTLRPSTVDLRRHVDEVVDDVRTRSTSDVELRVTMSGPVDAVIIDSARLRQIVGNLVENALRHTNEGHVEVAVHVGGSTLSVTVSDTGEGIPSSKLARIFEPFAQVDDSTTRVGGAGLGLSVVRNLVDVMGGRITATSVLGLGSRFRAELPVRLPSSTSPTAMPTTVDREDAPARRALLVEDDDTSALVTGAALERLGYDVERLVDGQAGVARVAGGCPHDLVLVDLHLPVSDGFAVIAAVERRPGQLVVAATASSHPGDLDRCRQLGVDAVLQKPVSSEQLADLLAGSASGDRTDRADPIDTEQLRRLVDLGVHHEVFGLLDSQIAQIRRDLLIGDAATMCTALHTMAGSMRVLGASSARDRLVRAEEHLRDGGDLLDVRDVADDLVRHVLGAVERAEEMVARLD